MASVVVKVKYEETLRRFNVAVNGDECLDLSIEGLKLKICSLFNLASESEFRLTYKDEDDDLVTLVDDDDLCDVVKQGLDPVRITVHLISNQKPQSSSGTSLNHDEPQSSKVGVSHKNATLSNSSVGNDTKPSSDGRKHEGVKSNGIEKRSELTGAGMSAKPPLYPSVSLDKSKHSTCNSSSSKWSKSARGNENKDIFALQREHAKRAVGFQLSYPAPACDQSFKLIYPPNRNSNKTDNMTSIVHTGITCDGCGLHPISGPRFKSKVRCNYDLCRGCFLRLGNEMDYIRIDLPISPQFIQTSDAGNIGSVIHNGITCDGCGVVPIFGPRFKSKVRYNYDLCNNCFSQAGNVLDYARIDVPLTYHHLDRAPDVDFLGIIIHNGVFCNGCGVCPILGQRLKSKVRHDYNLCSSCFVWMNGNDDKDYLRISRIDSPLAHRHPLSVRVPDVKSPGPLAMPWKYPMIPVRKLDSCFIKDVSIPNGTAMAPLTPFTKIWRMRNNGTLPWFRGLKLIWVGGDRLRPSDSVEIQVPGSGVDVGHELNIAVGFVAPKLPGKYTSSWRMVSGQQFGQQVSVQIQVDPSVDLTREVYRSLDLNLPPISSKTLFPNVANVKAEPGLDIGVTNSNSSSIVDQSRKIQMIPLNLEINDASSCRIPEASPSIQSDPTSDNHGELLPSSVSYPEADASSYSIPEGSTPLQSNPTSDNHEELLPSSVSNSEADPSSYSIPEASTPVQSDPISDNDGEVLGASSDAGNLDNNGALDKNINLEQVNENTETEEKLQKELEQIGFKQIDLDKKVDSEQSVDDSDDDDSDDTDDSDDSDGSDDTDGADEEVNSEESSDEEVVSEESADNLSDDDWDPILEELTEMGFEDKDKNKKLLEKNNGKITRVVMDLIAAEKA